MARFSVAERLLWPSQPGSLSKCSVRSLARASVARQPKRMTTAPIHPMRRVFTTTSWSVRHSRAWSLTLPNLFVSLTIAAVNHDRNDEKQYTPRKPDLPHHAVNADRGQHLIVRESIPPD